MLAFVTATDTNAGKTWVTASAIRSLLEQGINAKALKPIACGIDDNGKYEDIEVLLAAQNLSDPDAINCFRYALPAAPSQAAAAENKTIDPDNLVQWCEKQSEDSDTTLIEGVGGLMVPVTDNWLVSDWITAMPDCEVWLVVGCKLGAINQTLLTLEKLKQMDREPARIFFNAPAPECIDWLEPTRNAVEPFLPSSCQIHNFTCTTKAQSNLQKETWIPFYAHPSQPHPASRS